jgi:hypothetical protein
MRNINIKKKCLLLKHEKIIKQYPMTGRLIVTQGYMTPQAVRGYKNLTGNMNPYPL